MGFHVSSGECNFDTRKSSSGCDGGGAGGGASAAPARLVQSSARKSSILFGDTLVPNIELDHILFLGCSILFKEYYLTGFNHKKTLLKRCFE